MKKSQKSNRASVSWAPGANLCQVRLFSSGDYPSQSRPKDQYHLTRMGLNPQPPPRFRGSNFVKPMTGIPSRIPQMNWKCPPKIELSCKWLVAAGEESNETETQTLRERRVLEAVYPRLSDIPSSPSDSSNIEVYDHDDRNTPLVPITPIEDDLSYIPPETPKTTENHISTTLGPQSNENPPLGMLSGSETDISAAAALAAILKSTEHGKLIDTDLLIQIFKNPEMMEQIMNDHQAPPKSYPTPVSSSSLPLSRPELDLSFSSKPSERVSEHVQKMVQHSTIALKQDPISVSILKHTSEAVSSISIPKQAVPTVSSHMPDISNMFYQPSIAHKPVSSISTHKQAVSTISLRKPNTGNMFLQPSIAHKPVSSISTHKQAVATVSLQMPNTGNMFLQPSIAHKPVSSISTHKQAVSTVSLQKPNTGNMFLQPSIAHKPGLPLVKDLNYYKNLIRQHGVTKDEKNIPHNGTNQMVKKRQPNFQKTCMYFNSSKGCRNGATCVYQHDMQKMQSGRMLKGGPYAKRIKLGNEITGGT